MRKRTGSRAAARPSWSPRLHRGPRRQAPVLAALGSGLLVAAFLAGAALADAPLTRGQAVANVVLAALATVVLLAAFLSAGRLTRQLTARRHSGEEMKADAMKEPRPAIPPADPPRMPSAAARPGHPVPVGYADLRNALLRSADRADCCLARPSVIAVIPPAGDRPRPAELLLCGHHYRAHRAALAAAGATAYESDPGTPVSDAAGPAPLAWSPSASPA